MGLIKPANVCLFQNKVNGWNDVIAYIKYKCIFDLFLFCDGVVVMPIN